MPSAPSQPVAVATARNNSVCDGCGAAFRCGAVGGDAQCWCFDLPHVVAVPPQPHAVAPDAERQRSCLCPACLAGAIAKPPTKESESHGNQS